jgi:hypothetical protein
MTLSASPPKNTKLPYVYQKDMDWKQAQELRDKLIAHGYRYVTIKTKLNHEGSKMPNALIEAKIQKVRSLIGQGGVVVGDQIVFPDCIHIGYGPYIERAKMGIDRKELEIEEWIGRIAEL